MELREKGITTLRNYQYWIFHHTVIETYFEMLNFSEDEKLGASQTINIPIFKIGLKIPNLIFFIEF